MIDTETSQVILLQIKSASRMTLWAENLPVWSQSFFNRVSLGEALWEQGDLNLF